MNPVVVIGAGLAGLSSACYLTGLGMTSQWSREKSCPAVALAYSAATDSPLKPADGTHHARLDRGCCPRRKP